MWDRCKQNESSDFHKRFMFLSFILSKGKYNKKDNIGQTTSEKVTKKQKGEQIWS